MSMSVTITGRHWFGLQPADTAVAAWGARAIITGRVLDLVWNRQQCDPGCRGTDGERALSPLHVELHNELDSYFLPLLRQRLKAYDPDLDQRSDAVTEIHNGRVVLRCSPNASCGYLYICATIDRDRLTPDELPSLEEVARGA